MKSFYILFLVTVIVMSCAKETKLKAQEIIDKSIKISGGEKFKNSIITFDFRGRHYKAKRQNGLFEYSRTFKDSINNIEDVLLNDGFKRYINGELVKVPDSMIPRYSRSVNSVHYFSVLPFGLNDAAANKEYLGVTDIKEQEYYKIKVFFTEEGGGDDFEDVFVYWINAKDYKVEYLAYSYQDPGKEIDYRFRVAKNERYVSSLRFVDYDNYKSEIPNTTLYNLDSLYSIGRLKLVSKIENKNITVE